MGLNSTKLSKLHPMSTARSATLRFAYNETCVFKKEIVTEQEGRIKVVEQVETAVLDDGEDVLVVEGLETKTRNIITTTSKYHWTYSVEYKLYAFVDNHLEIRIVLQGRQGQETLVTRHWSRRHAVAQVRGSRGRRSVARCKASGLCRIIVLVASQITRI